MKKIIFGTIHADYITMSEAIEYILTLVADKGGGYIVTPNVDHVALSETNVELRNAYSHAALSLTDGMPLVWFSRLIGHPLPEKISGSDLIRPLLKKAAERHFKIYLLGAAQGIGIKAAERLKQEIPTIEIVGVDSPPLGFEKVPEQENKIFTQVTAAKPDIVLVALGCPKQELLMHRWFKSGFAPVMLGIGASLDFIAGKVKRAPSWMSSIGLEWLYRLSQDPKRLAKRYLIRDAAIIPILLRTLSLPKADRVITVDEKS